MSMSDFNERNSRPTQKLTLAGIAAVIVVGVFVVCVILVLAKSLFPSNDDSVPDGIYTGTKSSSSSVPETESEAEETDSAAIVDSVADSQADSTTDASDSLTESSLTTDSAESGETATLNQTAYLRSANDENSDPLLSITAGETVTVVERPSDSEYVHVTYNGYDGWVWNGYLS